MNILSLSTIHIVAFLYNDILWHDLLFHCCTAHTKNKLSIKRWHILRHDKTLHDLLDYRYVRLNNSSLYLTNESISITNQKCTHLTVTDLDTDSLLKICSEALLMHVETHTQDVPLRFSPIVIVCYKERSLQNECWIYSLCFTTIA